MRRLELAAILLIVNDLIESLLHPHLISVGVEITVGVVSIGLAWLMQKRGSRRAQRATLVLAILAMLPWPGLLIWLAFNFETRRKSQVDE